MRWPPERRRRWARVVVACTIAAVLLWSLGHLAWRAQAGELKSDDLLWWVCFPILMIGIPQTTRAGMRVWGAIIEWPAWRHRNEDPEARVFRGHPTGGWETLHEQRARRFEEAQKRAAKVWRFQVDRAADEIYGEAGPPEKPETPKWLKSDSR